MAPLHQSLHGGGGVKFGLPDCSRPFSRQSLHGCGRVKFDPTACSRPCIPSNLMQVLLLICWCSQLQPLMGQLDWLRLGPFFFFLFSHVDVYADQLSSALQKAALRTFSNSALSVPRSLTLLLRWSCLVGVITVYGCAVNLESHLEACATNPVSLLYMYVIPKQSQPSVVTKGHQIPAKHPSF